MPAKKRAQKKKLDWEGDEPLSQDSEEEPESESEAEAESEAAPALVEQADKARLDRLEGLIEGLIAAQGSGARGVRGGVDDEKFEDARPEAGGEGLEGDSTEAFDRDASAGKSTPPVVWPHHSVQLVPTLKDLATLVAGSSSLSKAASCELRYLYTATALLDDVREYVAAGAGSTLVRKLEAWHQVELVYRLLEERLDFVVERAAAGAGLPRAGIQRFVPDVDARGDAKLSAWTPEGGLSAEDALKAKALREKHVASVEAELSKAWAKEEARRLIEAKKAKAKAPSQPPGGGGRG